MKKLFMFLTALTVISYFTVPAMCASNSDILKDGLLGAATGAISAEASGGKAGKGALIGAGVNVVGGALLDSITAPKAGTVQESQVIPSQQQVQGMPSSDAFQNGYQQGYEQGIQSGYQQGYNAGFTKGYEAGSKIVVR